MREESVVGKHKRKHKIEIAKGAIGTDHTPEETKDILIKVSNGGISTEFKEYVYITMDEVVYHELMRYAADYPKEISGCGLVKMIEHIIKGETIRDNDTREIEFNISEIFLPAKQDNTMSSTDIPEEEIHTLMNKLINEGKDTMDLRLHWHSHANMGTFHSGTDEDNYETLLAGEWFISLVINKSMDILGRIDYRKPIALAVSGVPIYIWSAATVDIEDKVTRNLKSLQEYEDSKPATSYYNNDWTRDDNSVRIYNSVSGTWETVDIEDKEWDYTQRKWLPKKKEDKPYVGRLIGFSSDNDKKDAEHLKAMVNDFNLIYPHKDGSAITPELIDQFDNCNAANCIDCAYQRICVEWQEYMYGQYC